MWRRYGCDVALAQHGQRHDGLFCSELDRPDPCRFRELQSVSKASRRPNHKFSDAPGFSQEIVSFREANENNSTATPLGIDDPAFRALVEENVKNSVTNVVNSPQMAQHWGDYAAQNNGSSTAYRRDNGSVPLNPVYVHGEPTVFLSLLPD
jgi:hypothetical protein